MKTRFGSKYVATVLLALLVLVPTSLSYAKNQKGERFEKFKGLVEKAYVKVGDLVERIQGIEGIDLSELAALIEPFEGFTDVESYLVGIIDVESAKEAMITLRRLYGELHTFLGESDVDTESGAKALGLLTAINRTYERINRLRNVVDQISAEGVPYVGWVEGNLSYAEGNLTAALVALELTPPNMEWATGNKTQANKNIQQAFAALRLIANWNNQWRVESFLRGIVKSYERTEEMLERAEGQGIDVEELKALLQVVKEDIEGVRSIDWDGIKDAIEEINAIKEGIKEIRQALAELRKGGPGE